MFATPAQTTVEGEKWTVSKHTKITMEIFTYRNT